MQDGNRSMHIKKCSQRTKHLERRLRRMNDPSRGAQAALHHVSASPHRRPRAGPHNTRNRTFANPGIVLNLTHRKSGIAQSNDNGIAPRRRCGFNPVERSPEALRQPVGKGVAFPLRLFHIAQHRFAAVGHR